MEENNKLKKALTAAGIWSVAVGAVISGSYYGWNYIASETNFTGCLIAMAIATLFYIPFAFMFAELATAIPSSAGPAAYTEKAFGRGAGFFAGFSYLVESLFCTPGICIAVGAYVHTLFPVVPAVVASVVAYLIFLFINMRGIEAGQLIGLIVTIIGVAGVVFYACIGLPHADFSLLGKMGDLGGVKGIFVAIPYAVWFYLAFEAGGMGAEECKNPSKDIPKGFIVGIFTLLIGGMLMLVTTFSLLPKEELLKNDAPIANVINHLFGEGSTMSIVFIVIAMIGLIASLNGIIIGQSPDAGKSYMLTSDGIHVTLTVSTGVMLTEIPNLLNYDYREATSELEKLGFVVDKTFADSDDVAADCVMQISPSPGEKLPAGSTVYLTISQGAKTETVIMPYLVGKDYATAEAELAAARLTLVSVSYVYNNTIPVDYVVSQTVEAGTEIPAYSKIYLQISLGPETTPTPSPSPVPTQDPNAE